MEGLDRIAASIDAESREEAAELIRRAQTDCAQKVQEARRAADALREQTRTLALNQSAALKQQRLAAAELDARKRLLALRQELVTEGIRQVQEALTGLQGSEAEDFLARLALAALLTGQEALVLNPRDREAHGEALTARLNRHLAARGLPAALKLSETVHDRSGGLILRQAGAETDCTYEGLLRLKRGELSALLAAALFSGEEGGTPDEADP